MPIMLIEMCESFIGICAQWNWAKIGKATTKAKQLSRLIQAIIRRGTKPPAAESSGCQWGWFELSKT